MAKVVKKFKKYLNDQIVFYGDILGFKQCMEQIEQNKNYPIAEKETIYAMIDNIYTAEVYQSDEKKKSTGVNFIWLSDSFAFAGDKNKWIIIKKRLLNFISLLWASNFLFNGALSFGSLHNEKNIMGWTFVDSVLLQESCHTPEIVISKSFYENIDLSSDEIYVNNESLICFDYVYCIIKNIIENGAKFSCFDCLLSLCREGLENKEEKIRKKYKTMIKLVVNAIKKIYKLDEQLSKINEQFSSLI